MGNISSRFSEAGQSQNLTENIESRDPEDVERLRWVSGGIT